MFNPIDWMKEQYAESFCLWALGILVSCMALTFSCASGISFLIYFFASTGLFSLIAFLTTLVLFIKEENEKERAKAEKRKREYESSTKRS